jgi:hypothetical protein
MLEINADGKRRRMRRVIFGDHWRKVQPTRLIARHRRAYDAGCMAHDERHFLDRTVYCGNDQVTFILSPVIVHDNNDLATLKCAQRLDNLLLIARLSLRGIGQ